MTPLLGISPDHELGDCYRTCIAMVLNVPVATVPHFVEMHKDDEDAMNAAVDAWLSQYGLARGCSLFSPDTDPADIPMFVNNINPGVPAIISGRTATPLNHSVVVWNGKYYDPSPVPHPLVAPIPEANGGEGGYWVEFICVAHTFNLDARRQAQNG